MNTSNDSTFYFTYKKNYRTSLEIRKIYQVIPDTTAIKHQMIGVINKSNENYLYPSNYFISIELPKAA